MTNPTPKPIPFHPTRENLTRTRAQELEAEADDGPICELCGAARVELEERGDRLTCRGTCHGSAIAAAVRSLALVGDAYQAGELPAEFAGIYAIAVELLGWPSKHDLTIAGGDKPGPAIVLAGYDADDLRRVLGGLLEELGELHAGEHGRTFSILADLPAALGVPTRAELEEAGDLAAATEAHEAHAGASAWECGER